MKINRFKFFSTRSDRISYKRDNRHYIDFKNPINIIKKFKNWSFNQLHNKISDGIDTSQQ